MEKQCKERINYKSYLIQPEILSISQMLGQKCLAEIGPCEYHD